jgi:hypothetical protein
MTYLFKTPKKVIMIVDGQATRVNVHPVEEDDRIQVAADAVIAGHPLGFSPSRAGDAVAALEALGDAGIEGAYVRPELPRIIFATIADKLALLRGET